MQQVLCVNLKEVPSEAQVHCNGESERSFYADTYIICRVSKVFHGVKLLQWYHH